jgi:HSP20 family protein
MLSRFLSNRNDLTRSDDPFQQLQREIGRVVEDVFRGAPAGLRGPLGAMAAGFAPSLDVKETPQGLELTAELPGVREEDIELSLEGEMLVLRGEKREEKKTEERGLHIQERSFGSFQRSLRLPFAPEPGAVSASFDKGVLHVTLPKPRQAAQKDNRIPIGGRGGGGAQGGSGAAASGGSAGAGASVGAAAGGGGSQGGAPPGGAGSQGGAAAGGGAPGGSGGGQAPLTTG